MHVRTLATINTDTDTDVEIPVDGYKYNPEAILQIQITGTITIQVLGSLDGTNWVEVLAASAVDQLSAVALLPHWRFTSTGTSGGTAVIKMGINGKRE